MILKKTIFNFKAKYLLNKDKYIKELKQRENMSYSELETYNFEKRRKIVQFAYDNIPFYRNFYNQHNFNPGTLSTEKDWSSVPIITKLDLKNNTQSIINPSLPKSRMRKSTTGGSTGVPLVVYFDRRVPLDSFGWRTMNWWGIAPWENQAYVFRGVRKGLSQIINKIIWLPTRRALLDCSSMSTNDMDEFIKRLNTIKPTFIQGYVGGVFDLAKHIRANSLEIPKLKAIWVTAAPLSESTRSFIEETFKAPVYDQYGCSEMFWLAAECKLKSGLHALSDVRHIEFLNQKNLIVQDGDYGDVVITDLENKVFPIIRYKNGDSGRYLKYSCKCGLPFPLIDKIKGRTTDNIKTPSGIIVNGAYLTTIFDVYPYLVDGFQIIQKSDYSVEINCVLSSEQTEKNKGFDIIKKELHEKTNHEVDIVFNFSKTLIQDRGKLQFVISQL